MRMFLSAQPSKSVVAIEIQALPALPLPFPAIRRPGHALGLYRNDRTLRPFGVPYDRDRVSCGNHDGEHPFDRDGVSHLQCYAHSNDGKLCDRTSDAEAASYPG